MLPLSWFLKTMFDHHNLCIFFVSMLLSVGCVFYLWPGVEYQKCYKWQQVFSMFVFYLKSLWHFFFTPRAKIIAPVAWENKIQKRERLFGEKKSWFFHLNFFNTLTLKHYTKLLVIFLHFINIILCN